MIIPADCLDSVVAFHFVTDDGVKFAEAVLKPVDGGEPYTDAPAIALMCASRVRLIGPKGQVFGEVPVAAKIEARPR